MSFFRGLGLSQTKFSPQWHRDFLGRHKQLSVRATSAKSRKKSEEWNQEKCDAWIILLTTLHEDGFLTDPDGIVNVDESPFPTGETHDKVYAECGTREVESFGTGSDREHITTLFGGFASGRTLRPVVLYDGKMHIRSRFDGTFDDVLIGVNNSGVMDNKTMVEYFRKELLP